MTHKEKMTLKKERNRTQRPGFTPVLPTGARGVRRMVKLIGREATIKALT